MDRSLGTTLAVLLACAGMPACESADDVGPSDTGGDADVAADGADEAEADVPAEATDEAEADVPAEADVSDETADDGGGCETDPPIAEETLGGGPDPEGGVFTMDEALAGLPAGDGPLRAIVRTEHGELTCTLEPDLVPNGVANFVGLARGRRPWLDPASGVWVKRRFYDGLIFHRIIDDFMIQGGDPLGTGYGGPGYRFDDEVTTLSHAPGTLAYANSGPDTNGSQFYITEVTTG